MSGTYYNIIEYFIHQKYTIATYYLTLRLRVGIIIIIQIIKFYRHMLCAYLAYYDFTYKVPIYTR